MKPAAFEYVRPRDVDAALAELGRDDVPDQKVIAGGQSLLPMMNLRLAAPARLIDIGRLASLTRVELTRREAVLGALVPHRRLELDPEVARVFPVLRAAAAHIGHVGIRNRGTLGGSLAHADPAAELPAAMMLLDASVTCRSVAGDRRVPARELFTGPYSTSLRESELITEVRLPRPRPGSTFGFCEISPRRGDYAHAGALCMLRQRRGRIAELRAVLFAVGPTPVELSGDAELLGRPAGAQDWARVSADLVAGVDFSTDYVRTVATTALRRALRAAADGMVLA